MNMPFSIIELDKKIVSLLAKYQFNLTSLINLNDYSINKNERKITKDEIDCIVVCTQNPDGKGIPHTSAIIHEKLSFSNDCASFDISLGCSGYVYGLWMAHMMIASGTCKKVLLLSGDTISKYVNLRDRSTAPLFGDAGSATLVEKTVRELTS